MRLPRLQTSERTFTLNIVVFHHSVFLTEIISGCVGLLVSQLFDSLQHLQKNVMHQAPAGMEKEKGRKKKGQIKQN